MATIGPSTLAWVNRHLDAGEHILHTEALHGGITADIRRLTISTNDGATRDLVLRSYTDPDPDAAAHAEESLTREAATLKLLAGTQDVAAPHLVAVDPTAEHCEHPSLLMTHLPGQPILDNEAGLAARLPMLANQLVAIHTLRPATKPPTYQTLTTADTVVVPHNAETKAWAAALDVIRKPAPSYDGRFLHRDFHPGNVLFDAPSDAPTATPTATQITGVVDWAGTSWGPADLDVAHCCTNLALLHGPTWAQRFADAYDNAGGTLAADEDDRLYWRVRDALAFSEDVQPVAQAWQKAGRGDLTARAVEQRLNDYVTALMG